MHLTDLKLIDKVVQQLDETEGIAKVRADEDISNGFITVRNIASVISIALIAILLIISVFIISNTIKLTTFDRRDEIAIMKMVGATDGFIRWPSYTRDCCWDSSARQWPSGSSGCCMPPYPRASPIPTPCSCCGWWTSVRSGPGGGGIRRRGHPGGRGRQPDRHPKIPAGIKREETVMKQKIKRLTALVCAVAMMAALCLASAAGGHGLRRQSQ